MALVASSFNYARLVTDGMDLDLTYDAVLRNGHRLSARLLATRIFELTNYMDLENPSFPDRVLGEIGNPELALNLGVEYAIGSLSLSYGLNYANGQTIGLYEEQHAFNGNPPANADAYPRVRYPSSTNHAIRAEYAIGEQLSLFGGVDNLTGNVVDRLVHLPRVPLRPRRPPR